MSCIFKACACDVQFHYCRKNSSPIFLKLIQFQKNWTSVTSPWINWTILFHRAHVTITFLLIAINVASQFISNNIYIIRYLHIKICINRAVNKLSGRTLRVASHYFYSIAPPYILIMRHIFLKGTPYCFNGFCRRVNLDIQLCLAFCWFYKHRTRFVDQCSFVSSNHRCILNASFVEMFGN